jgi:hypothetical protein
MNKVLIIIIGMLAFLGFSCQKEADLKKVDYYITGLTEAYTVVYLDQDGNSVSTMVNPTGLSYKWIKTFQMEPGSPVYLYAKFTDNDVDLTMKFNFGILVNGKYEYQAKANDKVTYGIDTIYEVKRSGIVPLD